MRASRKIPATFSVVSVWMIVSISLVDALAERRGGIHIVGTPKVGC